MTHRWALLSFTLTLGLAVPQMLAQNFNADSELELGIAAYGKAKYSEAIDHLERAVTLNPKAVTATSTSPSPTTAHIQKNAIGTATQTSGGACGRSKNTTRCWNWNPQIKRR
jgi:hypothetical protein